jgi:hypothetical protein
MNEITSPMRKAYLESWKRREKPDPFTDYLFSFDPEKADTWETRQGAQDDCTAMFNKGIPIDVAGGGKYLCRNFVVEEREPGVFIVSCEAPFPGR